VGQAQLTKGHREAKDTDRETTTFWLLWAGAIWCSNLRSFIDSFIKGRTTSGTRGPIGCQCVDYHLFHTTIALSSLRVALLYRTLYSIYLPILSKSSRSDLLDWNNGRGLKQAIEAFYRILVKYYPMGGLKLQDRIRVGRHVNSGSGAFPSSAMPRGQQCFIDVERHQLEWTWRTRTFNR